MNLKATSFLALFVLLVTGCDTPETKKETEENAPEVTIVERPADQLLLPSEYQTEPWNVGKAFSIADTQGVRLDKILPAKHQIWGAAVSPQSGKAIITYVDKADRKSKKTLAITCDVRSGKALARWPVEEYLAPYSIHPDGDQAILCRRDGVRSARETLYIANRRPQSNTYELEMWRPLVDADSMEDPDLYVEEWEIMWAAYVGRERIVTLNKAGQMHVWDQKDRSRLAMIDDVVGTPTVTPDGSKVVFLTGDVVAMLDPAIPEITRAHRIGQLPEDPVVAIQPNGRLLAVGGKGQAVLMNLSSLTQGTAMIDALSTSQGMDLHADFCWVGNYLCSGRDIYNFDSPISIWRVDTGFWQMKNHGRIWAIVRDSNDRKRKIFRAFELPTRKIAEEVAKFYETSDVIALRVGDPVRIDVSGLPRERQEEVRATLNKRLKEIGYHVSANAHVALKASLEEPFEADVTYNKMWGGKGRWDYTYHIQKARLEFVKGEQTLWSSTKYKSPPMTISEKKMPDSSHVAEWGQPDYELFSKNRLPKFLVGRGMGSKRGRTVLLANGTKTYGP